jgi:arabinofuranan 3-O-arabinosyltransferase
VLLNWLTGQTGTWTAALLGGGLMMLDRRPVLAGILLGALVAKPQTAVLVPAALLAGRHWRPLIACAATAASLVAASLVLFGSGLWWQFAGRAQLMRHWILEDGTGVWQLFVSVFVSIRHLPAPLAAAYAAQGVAALAALAFVVWAWASRAPARAKYAVLVMAGFFATPYVQVYDLAAAALVPLWLLGLPSRSGVRVSLSSSVPLLLAPLLTLMVVRLTGLNPGWLLLLPALAASVRACARGRGEGQEQRPRDAPRSVTTGRSAALAGGGTDGHC